MDIFDAYIQQIKRYDLLTPEEEVVLSKKIEEGDKTALERLIQANLRLVVSVAKRFHTNRVSVMDLIQEGNLALMTAASKYHYSFNTRFSTYAYSWVLQYMLRYVNNKTGFIAVPHRKEEFLRRLSEARETFRQEYGRDATDSELAEELHISKKELKSLSAYEFSYASLDAPCKENATASVGDLIPDDTWSPEDMLLEKEAKQTMKKLLGTLPEKEREVITSRYNFTFDTHVKTLRELSIQLDVSAETIRQMEIRAVRRLRDTLLANPTAQSVFEGRMRA